MRKAHIKGALVGVEAVTPEGLKAVFKDFNCSGESLVQRLQTFRAHGVMFSVHSYSACLRIDRIRSMRLRSSRSGLALRSRSSSC